MYTLTQNPGISFIRNICYFFTNLPLEHNLILLSAHVTINDISLSLLKEMALKYSYPKHIYMCLATDFPLTVIT